MNEPFRRHAAGFVNDAGVLPGLPVRSHRRSRPLEERLKDWSDSRLTEAIRASDVGAFQALYYRYYEPLYQFLWHKTRSTEQVKDYIQELFTRVWIKRSRLNPDFSIRAYLYRIASNMVIDQIRKNASERTYRLHVHRNTARDTDSLDERITIQQAVEDLPEKLRLVFILSRYQGLKYTEIAEVCGISIKTVESRMSHALRRLRIELR